MKVLITDSFCSSNRGDAAILDAMIGGLRRGGANVDVVSHFPEVARHFHGIPALDDRDLVGVASAIAGADLVVSCGGSFLHDLYAPNLNPRLASFHLARRAGVPYVIFGQSIGPFVSPLSRQAAREVLDGAAWICVRDEASARVVRELGVGAPLRQGVDAAVVGKARKVPRGPGPVLGVTVRSWHFPGQGDAALLQDQYEHAVAEACDAFSQHTGGTVRFLSNCTSYGGYRQDDRVAARRVAARMACEAEVVEAADVDFATLRGECGACDFFLGTRMHSLIFATTAGVPAVGVAYEQKTYEWMRQLGCGTEVVGIEAPAGLPEILVDAWDHREDLAAEVSRQVAAMKAVAQEDMEGLLAVAAGARPGRHRATRRDERGWDGETWRFDVAHRRLRQVADIVVGEGGGAVLDLGCSTGLLGRMLGPAYDYHGVDIAPSVATRDQRFRVETGCIDGWEPTRSYDVVVASGGLEYVDDLVATVAKIRGCLREGGLAVLTLFNLAHFARAVSHGSRHPTWTLEARPDDFALLLREAGLRVQRVQATTVGYGPAPSVSDERPTELELDGLVQHAPERLTRLAHHWVFVCRAGATEAGPQRIEAELRAGHMPEALRAAVAQVRELPWAARAWSDLGTLWHAVGRDDNAREALLKAFDLDPTRGDVQENLDALGLDVEVSDPETGVMVQADNEEAWRSLVGQLLDQGLVATARVVSGMRRKKRAAA
ncbi:MAG: polysaccharide pyruvyl transferase family protein [Deltaproteobacteria bacterium]|nr:polysaccharide pyruvyl transferase family protein [Deltaproteobacteria bacterium]